MSNGAVEDDVRITASDLPVYAQSVTAVISGGIVDEVKTYKAQNVILDVRNDAQIGNPQNSESGIYYQDFASISLDNLWYGYLGFYISDSAAEGDVIYTFGGTDPGTLNRIAKCVFLTGPGGEKFVPVVDDSSIKLAPKQVVADLSWESNGSTVSKTLSAEELAEYYMMLPNEVNAATVTLRENVTLERWLWFYLPDITLNGGGNTVTRNFSIDMTPMIDVSWGSLRAENITIDGNFEGEAPPEPSHPPAAAEVREDSTFTLGENAEVINSDKGGEDLSPSRTPERAGGMDVYAGGTLVLENGSAVTGNRGRQAGGVYVAPGGNVALSGGVTVKDNIKETRDGTKTTSNLVLETGSGFEPIHVTGALSGKETIGVSRVTSGGKVEPGVIAVGDGCTLKESDLAAFFSDDPDYGFSLDDMNNQITMNTVPQVKWGDDANSLTNEGTIAQAVYAKAKYILLLRDINTRDTINLTNVTTLDGGGYTITGGGYNSVYVAGRTTIKDVTITEMDGKHGGAVMVVKDSADQEPQLTLDGKVNITGNINDCGTAVDLAMGGYRDTIPQDIDPVILTASFSTDAPIYVSNCDEWGDPVLGAFAQGQGFALTEEHLTLFRSADSEIYVRLNAEDGTLDLAAAPILLCDTGLFPGDSISIGGGTASLTAKEENGGIRYTLTLNHVKLESEAEYGITNSEYTHEANSLTVVLQGENTVSAVGMGLAPYAMRQLTIQGPGSLELESRYGPAFAFGGNTKPVLDGVAVLSPAVVVGSVDAIAYTAQSSGIPIIIAPSKPAVTPAPKWNPFTDVQSGDWFHDSVKYVYENGLIVGTSDTTFSPAMSTSRSMIAAILWRLAGEPVVNYALPFEDVPSDAWYAEAVRWAASVGVVQGYDNKTFGPDDPITREQLAAILYRYAGSPKTDGTLDAFADQAAAGPWATDALRWAVSQGILTGRENRLLAPMSRASRAEVSVMLARYCEKMI